MLSYALSYAFNQIDQHETNIITINQDNLERKMFKNVPNIASKIFFDAGWARTPGHGQMYGKKYIESSLDELVRMYDDGVSNVSTRVGPSRMLEKLKMNIPGRLFCKL